MPIREGLDLFALSRAITPFFCFGIPPAANAYRIEKLLGKSIGEVQCLA